jgi:hypothetical protein
MMTRHQTRASVFAMLVVALALLIAVIFPTPPAHARTPAVSSVSALPAHVPTPTKAPRGPMPIELLGFALIGATVKRGHKRRATKSDGVPLYLDSDVHVYRVNDEQEKELVVVRGGRPLDDVEELTDDEIDELTARRVIRPLRPDDAAAIEARQRHEESAKLAAEQAREMELLQVRHEAARSALEEAGALKTDEKKAQLAEKQEKERASLAEKHSKALAKEQE